MAKKNAKKTKNVLSTILVVLFVALLGNHIYYQVSKNVAEEPAEEAGYVLKFEGGIIDELDISDRYVEGMTWNDLIQTYPTESSDKELGNWYIIAGRVPTLSQYNGGMNFDTMKTNDIFYSIFSNGEEVKFDSVIDLSLTYTLVSEN